MSEKTTTLVEILLDTRATGAYVLGEAIEGIPRKLKAELRNGKQGLYRVRLERIER